MDARLLRESTVIGLAPYLSGQYIGEFDPKAWRLSLPDTLSDRAGSYPIIDEVMESDGVNRRIRILPHSKLMILEAPAQAERREVAVLRIVRDLLRWFVVPNAGFFHGGCFEARRLGICVLGQKRSGKTTTILAALQDAGAAYVSNDDVLLSMNAGRLTAHGSTRSISVRQDSLGRVLGLETPAYRRAVSRFDTRSHGVMMGCFRPNELPAFFGCRLKSQATVSAFIFPHFSQETGVTVTRLDQSDFRRLLRQNLGETVHRNASFTRHLGEAHVNKCLDGLEDVAVETSAGFVVEQNFESMPSNIARVLSYVEASVPASTLSRG